jgi:hypothetical protein
MYVGVVRGAAALLLLPGRGPTNRSDLYCGVRELCRAVHPCESGTHERVYMRAHLLTLKRDAALLVMRVEPPPGGGIFLEAAKKT